MRRLSLHALAICALSAPAVRAAEMPVHLRRSVLSAPSAEALPPAPAASLLGASGPAFVENRGQWPDEVRYPARLGVPPEAGGVRGPGPAPAFRFVPGGGGR